MKKTIYLQGMPVEVTYDYDKGSYGAREGGRLLEPDEGPSVDISSLWVSDIELLELYERYPNEQFLLESAQQTLLNELAEENFCDD